MRKWIQAFLVGALALGPAAALAAIDNSHHDMVHLGFSQEKCAYCHSKTGVTAVSGLGRVGGFCAAVCHSTGTGVAAVRTNAVPTSPGTYTYQHATTDFAMGNASSTTSIFINGHGMNKAALAGFDATDGAGVTATGWPHTATNDLQCTSCHAVHDSANPPFLNAKLSDGTQAGGFCQRCHVNTVRFQSFASAGNHPIEFKWDPTAAAGRTAAKTGDANTVMNRRRLLIGSGITNLNVTATGVDDAAAAGALDAVSGRHWNLGGKIVNPTTGLPTTAAGTAQFGCYSCHTVHVAQSPSNPKASVLTAGATLRGGCIGCHTIDPGMTTSGHPVDPETVRSRGNGWPTIPIAAAYTALPSQYKPLAGAYAPLCVSCHAVHDALGGRMAIRKIGGVTSLAATQSACELCHTSSFPNATAANSHHPGAAGFDYTGWGFASNMGWRTTDGLGDLADGLTCADCHVGDGTTAKRGTAHNWQ
jgi:predicted CXXCH cytochrome family protein